MKKLVAVGEMKLEVQIACKFLGDLLKRDKGVSVKQLEAFRSYLAELLCAHYKHHWHPQRPLLGSGYRCIRINHNMDPMIAQAAQASGVSNTQLNFPEELTIWVDPNDVSFRIGENGSICKLDGSSLFDEAPKKSTKEATSRNQESRKKMSLLSCSKDVNYQVSACVQC